MAKGERLRGLFVGMTPTERGGVLLVLAVLAFGVGAFNLLQGRASLVPIRLAFFVYIAVLAIPFILYRPAWGWLHPLVFWVLWVGVLSNVLPKLGVFANGLSDHRVMPRASSFELNAVVSEALLLTAIGTIAMFLGFIGAGRFSAPRLAFRRPRRLAIKTGLIAAIAVLALLMLIDKAGSIGTLMLQRGMSADERIYTDPIARIFMYIVGILKPACLVWLALDRNGWRNPLWLGFFVLALAIGFMATGSRSGVAFPILMAGAIWMLHYRRVPYTAIIAGFALSLVVLGVGGAFREATRGADSLTDIELRTGIGDGLVEGFQGMINTGSKANGTYGILASVPDDEGFLWGESYLSMPFAPIPGAILPFPKPEAGGKLNATRIHGIPSGGVPPGNIGEAYWNFGIPGVIGVMFLFGATLKWFYRLYVVNNGRGWVIVIYVITLFSLRPNSPAFYEWLHAVVPVSAFVLLYCGLPIPFRTVQSKNLERSSLRVSTALD